MRRVWVLLGIWVAACGSSSPSTPSHELTIRGHGTVTLDGEVYECAEDECVEGIELPTGPGAVDMAAESTDLDWVLTAWTDGETGEVATFAPTETLQQSLPLSITAVEVVFEPLEPCTPPTGLAGAPTLDFLDRICVTADRIAITGTHLGPLPGAACVYLNTGVATLENGTGAGGELTGAEVLLPGDLPAGIATIIVRTEAGRAMRIFGRLDIPAPAPDSIAPNPATSFAVVSLAGTDFSPDMLATLVGPATVEDVGVHGNGPTTAGALLPELMPGDYQLTLANECGENAMPGLLTIN